jgi:hypothetical protein
MKAFWDLFNTGQFTHKVTCKTCGTISVRNEAFDELLLFFPEPHHEEDQDCTVQDLIQHLCMPQDIDDYQCNGRCKGRTLATSVTSITTCPPILCIVLNRHKQNRVSGQEDEVIPGQEDEVIQPFVIKSSVQFPLSGFNITEDNLQYDLVGSVHYKQTGRYNGHNTSICKSQRSQSHNWFNYNDDKVTPSKFTSVKNDRVLKHHTKMANILFYVSGRLQTHIGSRGPIVDLQDDITSNQTPEAEDDEDGTEKKGGEIDAACDNEGDGGRGDEDGTAEGGRKDYSFSSSSSSLEEDVASTSSSESELNNWISQSFLQRVEGHYCSICREQHYLSSTDLATFETEAECKHVYCYIRLSSRKMASGDGNLTCPQCNCIASNIIHHQPIRLDDGLPNLINTPQEILGRSEGHQCGICFEVFKISDTDLETMDTTEPCQHIFCHECLFKHKAAKK